MHKMMWHIKQSISQAIFPILSICPVICNSKYEVSNRSRSLSRYCS